MFPSEVTEEAQDRLWSGSDQCAPYPIHIQQLLARASISEDASTSRPAPPSSLAAGSEHIIAGKTVRVNVAGPRPELPLLYLQPGHVQQPMAPPPPPAGLTGAVGGMGAPGGDPPNTATRGSGPRIYVGGIPTAVSETMVRNHFTQWGQVMDVYFPKDKYLNRRKNFCFVTFATQQAAEKAAAQSDREINGYRIESISITHDRQEHYQRQSVVTTQVGPASYGGMGQGGPADRSGMRWMGTARGAYGAAGANVGGPAGNLGGISSLSVPMAAMSIGGAGPRWPMAAAAGANAYLYGGMGGAVVGGYGDLQQQPAEQQPMLYGGVPCGSMDAMFGVGGQLAPGGQLGSGRLLDEVALRYMDPGAGALNYGQLDYTMPGGVGMSSDRIPTSMMLAGGVPYVGGAYFDAGLAAGMGPTMTHQQGQVTMSSLQQQSSLQQHSSQMLPPQHSLSSLASSPGTGSAAAALAEAHSAHSAQLDSIISPAAAAHMLASSRSLPLPQQQPQEGQPGGPAQRAGYPSRPQARSRYP